MKDKMNIPGAKLYRTNDEGKHLEIKLNGNSLGTPTQCPE